jgi:hypothetical protein
MTKHELQEALRDRLKEIDDHYCERDLDVYECVSHLNDLMKLVVWTQGRLIEMLPEGAG